MNTPADTPPPTSGRRLCRRRLGVVTVVAAVIVPGVALAQSTDRDPAGTAPAAEGAAHPTGAIAASVGISAAMVASDPVPTTADDEATREELAIYLDELQDLVHSQQFAPAGEPQLPVAAADLSGAVTAASLLVDDLTGAELAALRGLIDANPGWMSQPAVLADAIVANPFDLGDHDVASAYRAPAALNAAAATSAGSRHEAAVRAAAAMAPAASGDPAGIYTDCSQDAPDVRALFYSAWAAAQIAGAAGAVASGIPDAADYVALTIIAGVVFGVANGIAIGLDHALTIALDCVDAKDDAEFRKTLPLDPSAETSTNPTGITPGSTQKSVDDLADAVAGVAATVAEVNARTVKILAGQSVVIESLGVAAASAEQVRETAADLQVRAKDLRANIGTADDQAVEANRGVDCAAPPAADPCNTANGLANTTDARLDTILADTADLQALALRTAIERALSEPSHQPIALYALPADRGGYLELVGDLVAETIANLEAAGQSTGNASARAATAVAAAAAGDFVGAYTAYAQAYQTAVR